ncbi:MAG: RNA methyltransferase [Anaerolineales bacterium]|nr:RNA methyltransferase [Anaerolineales bacterium]
MTKSYQIRVCQNPSCGLRYPLTDGHPFGTRCPLCLGDTKTVLEKILNREPPGVGDESHSKILHVLLDNIRSAWNVGSILRTADGFGFTHAYLCGITPTPENKDVQKTALGADEFVTWSHHMDAVKLVKGLKKEGWKVWALEEDEHAQPIDQIARPTRNTVLILGSEVTGVDPALITLADHIFYIPMHGQKRSFNVAVAFGVAAWMLKA